MKASHYVTPRSLDAAHFDPRGQALHHFSDKREDALGVALAIALGVIFALSLLHWWAS